MVAWTVVLFLAGFFALGAGLREACLRSRLQQIGVRATGTVVRIAAKTTEDNARMYTPIVEFVDATGVRRQVRSRISGTGRPPAIGTPIPVVHLPDRPRTARLDTRREKIGTIGLGLAVGTVFLAVAVYLAAR